MEGEDDDGEQPPHWCSNSLQELVLRLREYCQDTEPTWAGPAEEYLCWCCGCLDHYYEGKEILLEQITDINKELLTSRETLRICTWIEAYLEQRRNDIPASQLSIFLENSQFGNTADEQVQQPIREILQHPRLLFSEELNGAFVKFVEFEYSSGTPIGCAADIPVTQMPGVFLLLIHPNKTVRNWASRLLHWIQPITTETYDDVRYIIAWMLSPVEFGLFDHLDIEMWDTEGNDVLPIDLVCMQDQEGYWKGIVQVFRCLDKEAAKTRLMGQNEHRNIANAIVNVIDECEQTDIKDNAWKTSVFWPALECLEVLLSKLECSLWQYISKAPDQILKDITAHPVFEKAVSGEQKSDSSPTRSSIDVITTHASLSSSVVSAEEPFVWLTTFVNSFLDVGDIGHKYINLVIMFLVYRVECGLDPNNTSEDALEEKMQAACMLEKVMTTLLDILENLLQMELYTVLIGSVYDWQQAFMYLIQELTSPGIMALSESLQETKDRCLKIEADLLQKGQMLQPTNNAYTEFLQKVDALRHGITADSKRRPSGEDCSLGGQEDREQLVRAIANIMTDLEKKKAQDEGMMLTTVMPHSSSHISPRTTDRKTLQKGYYERSRKCKISSLGKYENSTPSVSEIKNNPSVPKIEKLTKSNHNKKKRNASELLSNTDTISNNENYLEVNRKQQSLSSTPMRTNHSSKNAQSANCTDQISRESDLISIDQKPTDARTDPESNRPCVSNSPQGISKEIPPLPEEQNAEVVIPENINIRSEGTLSSVHTQAEKDITSAEDYASKGEEMVIENEDISSKAQKLPVSMEQNRVYNFREADPNTNIRQVGEQESVDNTTGEEAKPLSVDDEVPMDAEDTDSSADNDTNEVILVSDEEGDLPPEGTKQIKQEILSDDEVAKPSASSCDDLLEETDQKKKNQWVTDDDWKGHRAIPPNFSDADFPLNLDHRDGHDIESPDLLMDTQPFDPDQNNGEVTGALPPSSDDAKLPDDVMDTQPFEPQSDLEGNPEKRDYGFKGDTEIHDSELPEDEMGTQPFEAHSQIEGDPEQRDYGFTGDAESHDSELPDDEMGTQPFEVHSDIEDDPEIIEHGLTGDSEIHDAELLDDGLGTQPFEVHSDLEDEPEKEEHGFARDPEICANKDPFEGDFIDLRDWPNFQQYLTQENNEQDETKFELNQEEDLEHSEPKMEDLDDNDQELPHQMEDSHCISASHQFEKNDGIDKCSQNIQASPQVPFFPEPSPPLPLEDLKSPISYSNGKDTSQETKVQGESEPEIMQEEDQEHNELEDSDEDDVIKKREKRGKSLGRHRVKNSYLKNKTVELSPTNILGQHEVPDNERELEELQEDPKKSGQKGYKQSGYQSKTSNTDSDEEGDDTRKKEKAQNTCKNFQECLNLPRVPEKSSQGIAQESENDSDRDSHGKFDAGYVKVSDVESFSGSEGGNSNVSESILSPTYSKREDTDVVKRDFSCSSPTKRQRSVESNSDSSATVMGSDDDTSGSPSRKRVKICERKLAELKEKLQLKKLANRLRNGAANEGTIHTATGNDSSAREKEETVTKAKKPTYTKDKEENVVGDTLSHSHKPVESNCSVQDKDKLKNMKKLFMLEDKEERETGSNKVRFTTEQGDSSTEEDKEKMKMINDKEVIEQANFNSNYTIVDRESPSKSHKFPGRLDLADSILQIKPAEENKALNKVNDDVKPFLNNNSRSSIGDNLFDPFPEAVESTRKPDTSLVLDDEDDFPQSSCELIDEDVISQLPPEIIIISSSDEEDFDAENHGITEHFPVIKSEHEAWEVQRDAGDHISEVQVVKTEQQSVDFEVMPEMSEAEDSSMSGEDQGRSLQEVAQMENIVTATVKAERQIEQESAWKAEAAPRAAKHDDSKVQVVKTVRPEDKVVRSWEMTEIDVSDMIGEGQRRSMQEVNQREDRITSYKEQLQAVSETSSLDQEISHAFRGIKMEIKLDTSDITCDPLLEQDQEHVCNMSESKQQDKVDADGNKQSERTMARIYSTDQELVIVETGGKMDVDADENVDNTCAEGDDTLHQGEADDDNTIVDYNAALGMPSDFEQDDGDLNPGEIGEADDDNVFIHYDDSRTHSSGPVEGQVERERPLSTSSFYHDDAQQKISRSDELASETVLDKVGSLPYSQRRKSLSNSSKPSESNQSAGSKGIHKEPNSQIPQQQSEKPRAPVKSLASRRTSRLEGLLETMKSTAHSSKAAVHQDNVQVNPRAYDGDQPLAKGQVDSEKTSEGTVHQDNAQVNPRTSDCDQPLAKGQVDSEKTSEGAVHQDNAQVNPRASDGEQPLAKGQVDSEKTSEGAVHQDSVQVNPRASDGEQPLAKGQVDSEKTSEGTVHQDNAQVNPRASDGEQPLAKGQVDSEKTSEGGGLQMDRLPHLASSRAAKASTSSLIIDEGSLPRDEENKLPAANQNKSDPVKPSKKLTKKNFLEWVLSWNCDWLSQGKGYCYRSGILAFCEYKNDKDVPMTFESMDEYYEVFIPHLLVETWAQLRNGYDEQTNPTMECTMYRTDVTPEATERGYMMTCIAQVPISRNDSNFTYLNCDDFLIVSPHPHANPGWERMFAVVLQANTRRQHGSTSTILPEDSRFMKVTLLILIRNENFFEYGVEQQNIRLQVMGSLVPATRQFLAVMSLYKNVLARDILGFCRMDVFCHNDSRIQRLESATPCSPDEVTDEAVKAISESDTQPRIFLLGGPPGSGKTQTIINIIVKFLQVQNAGSRNLTKPSLSRPNSSHPKILLCAPSNTAVDLLVYKLVDALVRLEGEGIPKPGGKQTHHNAGHYSVIRLSGRRWVIHPRVKKYSLEDVVRQKLERNRRDQEKANEEQDRVLKELDSEIRKMERNVNRLALSDRREELKTAQETRDNLYKRRRNIEDQKAMNRQSGGQRVNCNINYIRYEVLKKADVICCTLNNAGNQMFQSYVYPQSNNRKQVLHFSCVIVDEATQCTEPDCLVPLQYGASKLVLVGDPQQLPATVISQDAARRRYNQSLFERFYRYFQVNHEVIPHNPVRMLKKQFRMHAEICRFPSQQFYEGQVETHSKRGLIVTAKQGDYRLVAKKCRNHRHSVGHKSSSGVSENASRWNHDEKQSSVDKGRDGSSSANKETHVLSSKSSEGTRRDHISENISKCSYEGKKSFSNKSRSDSNTSINDRHVLSRKENEGISMYGRYRNTSQSIHEKKRGSPDKGISDSTRKRWAFASKNNEGISNDDKSRNDSRSCHEEKKSPYKRGSGSGRSRDENSRNDSRSSHEEGGIPYKGKSGSHRDDKSRNDSRHSLEEERNPYKGRSGSHRDDKPRNDSRCRHEEKKSPYKRGSGSGRSRDENSRNDSRSSHEEGESPYKGKSGSHRDDKSRNDSRSNREEESSPYKGRSGSHSNDKSRNDSRSHHEEKKSPYKRECGSGRSRDENSRNDFRSSHEEGESPYKGKSGSHRDDKSRNDSRCSHQEGESPYRGKSGSHRDDKSRNDSRHSLEEERSPYKGRSGSHRDDKPRNDSRSSHEEKKSPYKRGSGSGTSRDENSRNDSRSSHEEGGIPYEGKSGSHRDDKSRNDSRSGHEEEGSPYKGRNGSRSDDKSRNDSTSNHEEKGHPYKRGSSSHSGDKSRNDSRSSLEEEGSPYRGRSGSHRDDRFRNDSIRSHEEEGSPFKKGSGSNSYKRRPVIPCYKEGVRKHGRSGNVSGTCHGEVASSSKDIRSSLPKENSGNIENINKAGRAQTMITSTNDFSKTAKPSAQLLHRVAYMEGSRKPYHSVRSNNSRAESDRMLPNRTPIQSEQQHKVAPQTKETTTTSVKERASSTGGKEQNKLLSIEQNKGTSKDGKPGHLSRSSYSEQERHHGSNACNEKGGRDQNEKRNPSKGNGDKTIKVPTSASNKTSPSEQLLPKAKSVEVPRRSSLEAEKCSTDKPGRTSTEDFPKPKHSGKMGVGTTSSRSDSVSSLARTAGPQRTASEVKKDLKATRPVKTCAPEKSCDGEQTEASRPKFKVCLDAHRKLTKRMQKISFMSKSESERAAASPDKIQPVHSSPIQKESDRKEEKTTPAENSRNGVVSLNYVQRGTKKKAKNTARKSLNYSLSSSNQIREGSDEMYGDRLLLHGTNNQSHSSSTGGTVVQKNVALAGYASPSRNRAKRGRAWSPGAGLKRQDSLSRNQERGSSSYQKTNSHLVQSDQRELNSANADPDQDDDIPLSQNSHLRQVIQKVKSKNSNQPLVKMVEADPKPRRRGSRDTCPDQDANNQAVVEQEQREESSVSRETTDNLHSPGVPNANGHVASVKRKKKTCKDGYSPGTKRRKTHKGSDPKKNISAVLKGKRPFHSKVLYSSKINYHSVPFYVKRRIAHKQKVSGGQPSGDKGKPVQEGNDWDLLMGKPSTSSSGQSSVGLPSEAKAHVNVQGNLSGLDQTNPNQTCQSVNLQTYHNLHEVPNRLPKQSTYDHQHPQRGQYQAHITDGGQQTPVKSCLRQPGQQSQGVRVQFHKDTKK